MKAGALLEFLFGVKVSWTLLLHLTPFILRNLVKLFFDASLEAIVYHMNKDGSQDV